MKNRYGQGTLPSSGGKTVDKTGVQNEGYVDKKGTPSGISAGFNDLPPGQNIEDQACADIREQPYRAPMATGYAEDGWDSEGGQKRGNVTKRSSTNIDLPRAGGDAEKQ